MAAECSATYPASCRRFGSAPFLSSTSAITAPTMTSRAKSRLISQHAHSCRLVGPRHRVRGRHLHGRRPSPVPPAARRRPVAPRPARLGRSTAPLPPRDGGRLAIDHLRQSGDTAGHSLGSAPKRAGGASLARRISAWTGAHGDDRMLGIVNRRFALRHE